MNVKVTLVIGIIVVLKRASAQFGRIPNNPCPNVFQYYQNDDNGMVVGYLEFPNDNSGYYELSVNMSIAAYLGENKNIRLELRTATQDLINRKPVNYMIHFPIQGILPKPTRIVFNNQVYCIGPQDQPTPGTVVTNMWATTYFKATSQLTAPKPGLQIFVQIPENPVVTQTPAPFTLPTLPSFSLFPSRPNSNGQVDLEEVSVVSIPSNQPAIWNPKPKPAVTTSTTAPFTNPPVENCGYSSITAQNLVVNGKHVKEGEFPWLVAIMYRQNFDYKYRCTGSLISRRHVITAGHCVRYHQALLFPIKDLLLVLGKYNINNWASDSLIRNAENITVHPGYRQNKGDYDIAVIKLNKDVELASNIRPVCIWDEDESLDKVVGQYGTVVGWGKDEAGNQFVPEAKRINLPIVSQVECLRSDPGFASLTSARTFCAGNRDGSGPCTGDSGGGFFMNRKGRWTLRGVVSLSLGDMTTCDPSKYFVFVDAAKMKNWIFSAMMI